MNPAYTIGPNVLPESFGHFRQCGQGRRECQVLWISPWSSPDLIVDVVHAKHRAHAGGFVIDDGWLNDFWLGLERTGMGIRVQVHTHPQAAFHSETDDEYPIIHRAGFLSLVFPNFGLGAVGFDGAYLTERQADGTWRQINVQSRLRLK